MIPLETPDVDSLQSWIGRQQSATDVVGLELVRRFQATLGLESQSVRNGMIAPALIHFCLAQPVAPTDCLADDGHIRAGEWLPPIPLPQRMWAGGRLHFHEKLLVGDPVTRTSRLVNIAVKQGRTGPLCFVTIEHIIDVRGRIVLNETQEIVYRSHETGSAPKSTEPADSGRYQKRIVPSAALLFRYSALTFNSHRIHYDRRYAVEVERYPGLVVHGPLQATLLMQFAHEIHGSSPERFTYNSFAPLFDAECFSLHAREKGRSLQLWTARSGGPVAMLAEAHWP